MEMIEAFHPPEKVRRVQKGFYCHRQNKSFSTLDVCFVNALVVIQFLSSVCQLFFCFYLLVFFFSLPKTKSLQYLL